MQLYLKFELMLFPLKVLLDLLLAESHISIHTWPECEFAAVDAFTCGETTDPEKACNYLAKCFDSIGYHISFIERASPKLLSNHPVELV